MERVDEQPAAGAALFSGFPPIDKRRAFEQVLERLDGAMVQRRLLPGDRLPPERELSEQLGVSRPSLREALRVLEAMGIVESRRGVGPSSGTFVAEHAGDSLMRLMRLHLALSHFPLEDFLGVRRILERSTVREAAARRTPDDVASLRALLAEIEASKDDQQRFFRFDAKLHVRIAQISGNTLVTYIMEAIRDAMTVEMTNLSEAWRDWDDLAEKACRQHKAIIDAIEASDREAAQHALDEHLRMYIQTA